MSDLRKAAQAVLSAWDDPAGTTGVCRALDALRAALAEPTVPSDCPPYSHQPTPQPVAWMKTDGAITTDAYQAACWRDSHTVTPLYAAPPQRQPLHDMNVLDIADLYLYNGGKVYSVLGFARAIERAHGIGGKYER